jgi:group II intron reverse transcriptase/maturase
MNGCGKSDSSVVPEKQPNKAGNSDGPEQWRSLNGHEGGNTGNSQGRSYGTGTEAKPAAEAVEGRELAEGNSVEQNRDRTQCRAALKQALNRVRQAAKKDRRGQLTALWHHVYNVARLREAYHSLKPTAAAGIDEVTWEGYGESLEANLQDLSQRLKRGAYRAKPVRRVYIPKQDGSKRPIGIPSLEDKIVQRATVEVMNAIYEDEFMGFSYGSRPGRSQHNALDALWVGLMKHKVNWVLDADIRGFFDTIDHGWLERFVEHRIGDRRVVRHIKKWLKAGVLEDGHWREVEEGTPQGGSVSPLLSNIYLHYTFDLWANKWRRSCAEGEVIIVRYCDDIVVGFQYRRDAERFKRELTTRFEKFNLELSLQKTRLLEFGRYAAERRAQRGAGRPEPFKFLGFLHICGKARDGSFVVRRNTETKRMDRTLKRLKQLMRARIQRPIKEQGTWLASVLRGHFHYYGVPGNGQALSGFRRAVIWLWYRRLRRRSQRSRLSSACALTRGRSPVR